MSTRTHEALPKAATLAEALPWLKRFSGRTVVVKYGGNAMTSPELAAAFAEDVVLLRLAGVRVVVVHGGGPQITAHLDRLGLATEFRGGLRVTSDEAMHVVRLVLLGQVNPDVVAAINVHGPYAVGLSGQDGHLFAAQRRGVLVDGRELDAGAVGEVVAVDPQVVTALLDQARIPVVATVSPGEDGRPLNVNADSAAASLAVALRAEKLVVLTDVDGLHADWPAGDVVGEITADDLERLLPRLTSGMVPKMGGCLQAVRGGVPLAHVLDGRVPHSLLLQVFTDTGVGTVVRP